jgi:hypothetical protein
LTDGLHITPDILEAAYRYLMATPPFRRWKLPDADEVEFHVIRVDDRRGDWNCYQKKSGGGHIIRISAKLIGRTQSLIEAVAHEMVHARCEMLGDKTASPHGGSFKRLAGQVCRHHGFDPKLF